MGLAASQARLLVLTARKSDLEFRAQMISNRKLLLAAQTENIAMDYSRKLSNRQMRFVYNYDSNQMQDINELFTIDSIYSQNAAFIGAYRVVLPDGRIAVPDAETLAKVANINLAVDNGVVISGAFNPTDIYQSFASLDEKTKLTYLAQALTTYCSDDNYNNLTADEKTSLDSKVVKDSGEPVGTCKEAIASMIESLYGKEGATGSLDRTKDDSFTTALAENLSSNAKSMIESLINVDGVPGLQMSETDWPTTKSAEHYAKAVNVINKYYRENKEASDSFLDREVTTSSFPQANNKETITRRAYLNNMATAFANGIKAGSIQRSDSDYTKMLALLNDNVEQAALMAYQYSDFRATVSSSGGRVVVGKQGSDGTQSVGLLHDGAYEEYVIIPGLANSEFFQNALREGSIQLEKYQANDKGTGGEWKSENWAGSSIIQDKLYTDDDAAAEAEYETQTAIIQRQDKMLDVEMKQVETQQKACENEIDAVKKILDKNVEKSFKYMS